MPDFILVDTSVWIKHLMEGEKSLTQLLEQGLVVCHPLIIGELACGGIKNRHEIISLLNDLPSTDVLDHSDIMEFIEYRNIMSKEPRFKKRGIMKANEGDCIPLTPAPHSSPP